MWTQLFLGGIVSFVNFGIHALMTGMIIVRPTAPQAHRPSARLHAPDRAADRHDDRLMCAHVVEIAVWALFYCSLASARATAQPFEFAFENYTALGYGDPVAGEDRRLIGPITALNGLLLIGWSVAIIFEVMRMAEVQFGRLDATRR